MALIKWFNNQIRPHLILCSSFSNEYYFPEEILVQIICRIPADRVLLFKSVCRRWKSLISSSYFLNLHNLHLRITIGQPLNHHNDNNNHISILVFTINKYFQQSFGIYEGGLGSGLAGIMRRNMRIRRICLPETRSILQTHYKRLPPLRLLGCIDGLLVFDDVGYAKRHERMLRCPERIMVLNPITRESRVIGYPEGPPITPQTRKLGYVCAIFFDRFQHQHTLLHVSNRTNHSPVLYHTFSFTNTAWRRIQITHTTPSSSLAPANCAPPCLHTLYPVIVGDTLHWLVDQRVEGAAHRVFIKIVMALKIHSNEIHYFRLPITPTHFSFVSVFDCDICLYSYVDCNVQKMQLIEHNGKLCFCHIRFHGVIDIWSMEECSWVKMFKLNLPCRTPWILDHHQIWGPMILSFPHKDVVAVKWTGNRIYLYHLGTYKACRIKDGMVQAGRGIINHRFIAFNKTLLSPNITF